MDRLLEHFSAVATASTATLGATAWTAREPDTDEPVLIKRLPNDTLRGRATLALSLRHPCIAPTTKWLYDGPDFYVIRSYVAGDNLRDMAQTAALNAFSRLKLALDRVLSALELAHETGLPHGGITPENIIFDESGTPVITDFATVSGARAHYVPEALMGKRPSPRADFYALCELYKEFIPDRPADDAAGRAAKERLLRNLSEVQQTSRTADELRYKLDAVARMAAIMGFDNVNEDGSPRPFQGARLVCSINPPTAMLTPGGVTGVIVGLDNTGDIPLNIESVGSDVVWLNPVGKAARLSIAPDTGIDLPFTLSGARLRPGDYVGHVIVRSNNLMSTPIPPTDTPWYEQQIALPVIVAGTAAASKAPLVERLPDSSPRGTGKLQQDGFEGIGAQHAPIPRVSEPGEQQAQQPGQELQQPGGRAVPDTARTQGKVPEPFSQVSCKQDPNPVLVHQGEVGVLHITITFPGTERMRIDRISTWPPWLVYPGDFKPVTVLANVASSIGFSVLSPALTPGDYTAEITLITSALLESDLGAQTVWHEIVCPVTVRVLRPLTGGPANTMGCAPVIVAAGIFGLSVCELIRLLS